eukprot:11990144-Alexandrium_andersonii.AAC.1
MEVDRPPDCPLRGGSAAQSPNNNTMASGVRSLNCPGPGTASNVVPQSSGGVRYAPFLAQTPNLPTNTGIG